MTHLSRKSVFFALLAIIALTVILRYPMVDHERNQSDSYFIHHLAGDITSSGRARWIVHPLSYIGYYPLSYPSGIPFLLSESVTVTGLTPEGVILLTGVMLGALCGLSSFCLIRIFINRTEYALLGACLVALSSRFVDTSYFVASARGPLAVLILLTIIAVIEGGRRNDFRFLLMGGLLAATCVTVHHMAVFLLLFALAYIIVAIDHSRIRVGKPHGPLLRGAFYGMVILALVVIIYGMMTHFRSMALSSLGSTSLFDFEPRFISVILNALAVYTSQIGFVFPLAFLGVPYLLMRKSTTSLNLFPFAVLIVFIPLIGYQIYVSLVIAPYTVALGLIWLHKVRMNARKRVFQIVFLLLVASSLALPPLFIDRWNDTTYVSGDSVVVDADIFNVANYCGYYYESQSSVSNAVVLSGLVGAISGVPFLGSGISALLIGDVAAEDIEAGLRPVDGDFPLNPYSWFEYDGDAFSGYFRTRLMRGGISYLCDGVGSSDSDFRNYLACHSRLVVYVDNLWPASYVTQYSSVSAVFPSELAASESTCEYTAEAGTAEFASFLVFESGRSSMYLAQLPIPAVT